MVRVIKLAHSTVLPSARVLCILRFFPKEDGRPQPLYVAVKFHVVSARQGGHGPCGIILSLVERTVGVANGLGKCPWVRSFTASPVVNLECLRRRLRVLLTMFRTSAIFSLIIVMFSKIVRVQFAACADRLTVQRWSSHFVLIKLRLTGADRRFKRRFSHSFCV